MTSTMELAFTLIRQAGLVAHRLIATGTERQQALQQAAALVASASSDFSQDVEVATQEQLAIRENIALLLESISEVGPSMGLAWAENAFATIEISAILAASFAATSMPKEYVSEVRMPWRCFRIVVPPGVVGDGAASILTVHAHTGKFYTITATDHGVSWGQESSLEDFVNMSFVEGDIGSVGHTFDENADERHRRIIALHQIVVGVCVELAMQPHADPPPGWINHKKIGGTIEPKVWSFKLARSVSIDCRAAVRSNIAGGGTNPTVRTLVRGHYKWQPYGLGRAQRKWIHLEPYWRGDKKAPIAIRPHRMGGEGSDQ